MYHYVIIEYTIFKQFLILRIAAVHDIRLSKIKTLTLRQFLGTNVHHRTKFHQNRSNSYRDMAI